MQYILLPLLFIVNLATLKSQTTPSPSPATPIRHLFAAMQLADTTGLAACFHPDAQLSTVVQQDGKITTKDTDIDGFISSLVGMTPGDLVEELHYLELRQDGDLATAWTPYTFVFRQQISHCGTNAFQLTRTGEHGAWQIYRITDTRGFENCVRKDTTAATEKIDQLADAWHQAATDANGKAYFDLMDENAIFIGTDATEHWDKDAFKAFALPYFDKGKAWDFKKIERHIFVDTDENIAYWDELLDTWMGPCRGTGIAHRQADGSYLIKHYTLSVTIDNDQIQGFIELKKDGDRK